MHLEGDGTRIIDVSCLPSLALSQEAGLEVAVANTCPRPSKQLNFQSITQSATTSRRYELTDDDKGQIRPVQQHRLVLRAHTPGTHLQQLEAARRGAHEGEAAKREASELGRARRRPRGREAADEVGGEGQLQEGLDVEEDLEPGLVGGQGVARVEEGVAREGDVVGAQAQEEVQRRGRGVIERLGVKSDEVEGCEGRQSVRGWVGEDSTEQRLSPSMPNSCTLRMSRYAQSRRGFCGAMMRCVAVRRGVVS